MKALLTLVAGLATATVLPLRAAESGAAAVVVYNSRLAESKAVAQHYAQQRGVPADQVFGFDLPATEDISRAEFRKALQLPLAKALVKHHLWRLSSAKRQNGTNAPIRVIQSRIRYAVLCYGVPLRIESDPQLQEPIAETLRPELRRNEAAVDSELALLPLIEQNPPLTGPLRNPVFGMTNGAAISPTNGVLMVARLDGPSADIATRLVDKALEAERDGLWGRAYFDLRNTTEPGFKMGDDWIRTSAEIASHLGLETVVDDQPGTFPAGFPMSQIAFYMGWYAQDVCGPFAQPTVEFMPGAFAYHLHSYSAVTLRSTNRAWVGPLLAKGATATMGCVAEPYLTGTPELAIFTSRFIYHGFSFGEAAYASQPVLSWQVTVVGDPLYRPFAKSLQQLHEELAARHSALLPWSYLRLIDLNAVNGRLPQAIALLEQLDLTKKSAVLSEKLGDLYAAQGKPSSAVHEWQQALTTDPSPQQRIRLLLDLGEKLSSLDQPAEAYEDYQALLNKFPEYPDKAMVYRRLLPLAQQLQKTNDLARYETALQSAGH
jgi:uncharacterized protein (TIGR03790 family)